VRGSVLLVAPRDFGGLKTKKIYRLFCGRTLYVPRPKLTFIPGFPAHFVGLFGTTSDMAEKNHRLGSLSLGKEIC
jgi:hypothetical protein